MRRDVLGAFRGYAKLLLLCLGGIMLIASAAQARSQRPDEDRPQILRDAETEFYIRRMATPIFHAANIEPESVTIALVQDNSLNAFVANGRNMFFHTGLLMAMEDASELLGVIAHETGHIAGGHLIRGRAAMEDASTQAIFATVLGVAAAAGTGRPDAGIAVIAGGQQLALRTLFAFSRTQEFAADQAGLRFLEAANLSSAGFEKFMQKLADQELLPASRQSAYVRTHPLTRERVEAIAAHVQTSAVRTAAIPTQTQADFRRIRAKIEGYIFPRNVLQKYDAAEKSLEARYARAIALWRDHQYPAALTELDKLIAEYPQDPFFYEQKGQILVETGRVSDGALAYEKAYQYAPKEPLIALGYAQAMLQSGQKDGPDRALPVLRAALTQDRRLPLGHRLLAQASARLGHEAEARLASAEAAFLERDLPAARQHITVAMKGLSPNSPAMIQAQDLESQIERAEQESDE